MVKRRRRKFTKEYKREVVKLVRDSDKGVTAMARELGIELTVLRGWISMVEAEEKSGLTPTSSRS